MAKTNLQKANTGGRGKQKPAYHYQPNRKTLNEKLEQMADISLPTVDLSVLGIPDISAELLPKPHDFFESPQAESLGNNMASQIFAETFAWLKHCECESQVPQNLVERYSFAYARWIQCEEINSSLGLLSKHPTTQEPITSPFVSIGINYLNQADRLWNQIFDIVKGNCSKPYSADPQSDMMENLLRKRNGNTAK